ncbi:hypothetical protein [Nonomuraea longicatena]|uniref:hypothetical protein n=1 Tax=Nonomuraea longicatena TaxID=83682 RepID=UPI0031CE15FF
MIGVAGCTAGASTDPTTSPSVTQTATGSPAASRPDIEVNLNPDRVTAGETSKVWILANCPVPSGGPAHTGTAGSKAFVSGVALDPVPAPTPSASPTSTAKPAIPWVRGRAEVSARVKRGTYTVEVKCEGTNDVGSAKLRITKGEDVPDGVPTKAPKAGGGGTFGQAAAEEDSSFPIVPAGALLAVVLAGGVGLAVRRRKG